MEKKKKSDKASSKVGQAVLDLHAKDDKAPEVGEIISEYAPSYVEEIKLAIKDNRNRYESPFYIVVLTKKEPWALNVMRNWFVTRQTKPSAKFLRESYPNHMHTVYAFDSKAEKLDILWSLPTEQDAAVIARNFSLYDPQLVKWVSDYSKGVLI